MDFPEQNNAVEIKYESYYFVPYVTQQNSPLLR